MAISGATVIADPNALSHLKPSDLGAPYSGPFMWRTITPSADMCFYNTADGHSERNGPCLKFGPLPNLGGKYIGSWLSLTVKAKQDADDGGAWDSAKGGLIWTDDDISWTESSSFASSPYASKVFTGRTWSVEYSDVAVNNWIFIPVDRAAAELAGVDYWYAQNGGDGFAGLSIISHAFRSSEAWANEDGKNEKYTGDSPNKTDSITFYPRGSAYYSPILWIAAERHAGVM